jgi:hypothetical protein
MSRRFASLCLSVLMLAALTGQGVSAVIAAGPPPGETISPALAGATSGTFDVTQPPAPTDAPGCILCVLAGAG